MLIRIIRRRTSFNWMNRKIRTNFFHYVKSSYFILRCRKNGKRIRFSKPGTHGLQVIILFESWTKLFYSIFVPLCSFTVPYRLFYFNLATSYKRKISLLYFRSQQQRRLKVQFIFWFDAAKKCIDLRDYYHKSLQRRWEAERHER